MFDPSSFAAVLFAVALSLTLFFGRRRASAPPPVPVVAPPPPAPAPQIVITIPRRVYADLDRAVRISLHPPGAVWVVVDRHVEIGPIVQGSDLHEQLVTSLLAARVQGWSQLPTGGV